LDAIFPNRWIGRDGPTPWPSRSPDITPLDFFLWRYVKDKVFSTPVTDITNLKARITDAFATIDRLCGLVVRVSGYRYRGPGLDPRRYQIF